MLKKNIKIDREAMELISLFNNISGAIIKDCLIFKSPENDSEIIIFLVKEEDVGKAIGKAGEHVKDLKSKLQKKIDDITHMGKEPIIAVIERRGEIIYYKISKINFFENKEKIDMKKFNF